MKSRLFGLVFLIAALVIIYVPAHAQNEEERCFEETGFCIAGRIRTYWEENGGLAVFGYPIGPQQEEEVEGQLRQVQRFERNRLELHPENDPPYDVLLGRLSEERLLQLDRVWQDEPRQEGPQDGCLWFEETSLNVCDEEEGIGFRSYWEANGLQDPELDPYAQSLALFGLPLTPPQTETNSSGDTVLTMWFERVRMEWHPDNPDEFKVLLGLLGNEIRDAGATTEPYPAPAPEPPEEPSPEPEETAEPEEPSPEPEETAEPSPEPPATFNDCQADPDPASAPNTPIQIVTVVKDAEPEVVQLQNVSDEAVNLDGWLMCSIDGDQEHTGISGTLEPNETRDFPYVGTGTIWDNEARDDGALYNADGELISYWSDE